MRRHLRKYLLAVTGIAFGSLILSYHVCRSDAWFWRFGAQEAWDGFRNLGGVVEAARIALMVIIFYLLAKYALQPGLRYTWGSSCFPKKLVSWKSGGLRRAALLVLTAAGFALLLHHVWWGPAALRTDFESHVLPEADLPRKTSFSRYVLPYVCYLPYSICCYMLVAVPLIFLILISLNHDRRKLHALRKWAAYRSGGSLAVSAINLRYNFKTFQSLLRKVMNRYLWVLVLIAVYYYIEIQSTMIETLSLPSQIVAGWSAWAFALLIVPCFLVRTYRRFTEGNETMRDVLSELRGEAIEAKDLEALGEIEKGENEVQADPLLRYVKLLGRTTVVFVLLITGISSGVAKVYQKISERKLSAELVINKVLPAPLDLAIIRAIGIFTPERRDEKYTYRLYWTTERPSPKTVEKRYRKVAAE